MFIRDWFASKNDADRKRFLDAFSNLLEVVILVVPNESEAFQLFDSQNTRGRELDPHDLLKAYHLREMRNYPYDMQRAVTKWEAIKPKEIKELFSKYLFPIMNWTHHQKSRAFTSKEIDVYKGISKKRIKDIIYDSKFVVDFKSEIADSDDRVRFESIISFPYFLLHVLKIYVWANGIEAHINELLDDKKTN